MDCETEFGILNDALGRALRVENDDDVALLVWLRKNKLQQYSRDHQERGPRRAGRLPIKGGAAGKAPDVPRHICKHVRCITLTSDVEESTALWKAVGSIVKSNMFDIIHYYAALELTKQGIPHIHLLVYANCKYFDASKIKAFWKKRYECVKPLDKTGEDYYKYLYKDINNPTIIDYCEKHGVAQTKSSEEGLNE